MMMAHGHIVKDTDVVRHICDNPPCVNPAHLIVGTQAQNMADMKIKGRHVPAYAIPKDIRAKIKMDDTPIWAVAAWFGVSPKTIRNIRK
jgi:HNH endonuclease